jgi:hypothetical protein
MDCVENCDSYMSVGLVSSETTRWRKRQGDTRLCVNGRTEQGSHLIAQLSSSSEKRLTTHSTAIYHTTSHSAASIELSTRQRRFSEGSSWFEYCHVRPVACTLVSARPLQAQVTGCACLSTARKEQAFAPSYAGLK